MTALEQVEAAKGFLQTATHSAMMKDIRVPRNRGMGEDE